MLEYKVIAAPRRTKKIKGVKGAPNLFAQTMAEILNEMAAEGWHYVRSDALPVDEKPGLLKSRVEVFHTVLVFARETEVAQAEIPAAAEVFAPAVVTPALHVAAPPIETAVQSAEPQPEPQAVTEPVPEPQPEPEPKAASEPAPRPEPAPEPAPPSGTDNMPDTKDDDVLRAVKWIDEKVK